MPHQLSFHRATQDWTDAETEELLESIKGLYCIKNKKPGVLQIVPFRVAKKAICEYLSRSCPPTKTWNLAVVVPKEAVLLVCFDSEVEQ